MSPNKDCDRVGAVPTLEGSVACFGLHGRLVSSIFHFASQRRLSGLGFRGLGLRVRLWAALVYGVQFALILYYGVSGFYCLGFIGNQ